MLYRLEDLRNYEKAHFVQARSETSSHRRPLWPDKSRSEKMQKAGLRTAVHKQALDLIGSFVPSFRYRLGRDGNSQKARQNGDS